MRDERVVAANEPPETAPAARRSASWRRRVRTAVAAMVVVGLLVTGGLVASALVQGRWMVTPVLSGSMRPGFAVGGVVISERVPAGSIGLRDVIVFPRPGQPNVQIVHRVVHMTIKGNETLIRTQGDANLVRDPWTLVIKGGSVYRVRWAAPLVGYVAIAFQNHRGPALLGAGVLLVAVASASLLGTESLRGRRRKRPRRSPEMSAGSTADEVPEEADAGGSRPAPRDEVTAGVG